MDECRKRGMDVWMLDDARFPTGYAAGRAEHSPHRKLYLKERHIEIQGPQKGTSILVNAARRARPGTPEVNDETRIVAVVAGRRIEGKNMDHTTHVNVHYPPVEELVDLTDRLDGDVIYWDIPEGRWRIFIIETTRVIGSRQDIYINSLTKEGTKILIDTVYEAHYQHYKDDFGKTFKGFFSDEPQMGNAWGYHAMIGRFPQMPLPWSDEMHGRIDRTFGGESRKYWPGFWYDIGEKRAKMQFAYMDAQSSLFGENFGTQIGDWCRAHNAEYMGHVIEESNAHARLGAGPGHYFRALWGQDFGGIDIVLNGLIPGIKGGSHTSSVGLESDDDFFYYALAQMAASIAHIDPKKKGRAMCEIFGAFGWQEGVRQMKWLADFMMARGINYYVPHAFSPKEFPDPDCPPHFYARGENPQFRYFGSLMKYMNRVCSIIDGGVHKAQAAVLYHGEAEWASSDYMKMQEPMMLLTQNQIEADILPADILTGAACREGKLVINGEAYGALVIPYAKYVPAQLVKDIVAIRSKNVPVLFIDGLPENSSTVSMDINGMLKKAGCAAVPLYDIVSAVSKVSAPLISTSTFVPDLKVYPYEKNGSLYVLLFNEGVRDAVKTKLFVADGRRPYFYDAMGNRAYHAQSGAAGGGVEVELNLPAWGALVLVFSDEVPEKLCEFLPETEAFASLDGLAWRVSTAKSKDYPNFAPCAAVSGPGNLNRADTLPRFSGTVRYETEFEYDGEGAAVLDMGEVGEIAHVFLNGEEVGVRCQPPYRVDLTDLIKQGANSLRIDVTNTLVYQQHDWLSCFHAIQASGLVGPVTLQRPKGDAQ